MDGADPTLVERWLHARSLARGLPRPIADGGGWRVDTGLPGELRRHVYAAPCEELRDLAHAIDAPRIILKLCADEPTMRALLPDRWRTEPDTYVMTCDHWTDPRALPPGYHADITREGQVTSTRITTGDTLAASGYAAEHEGLFVYDRIVTAEGHRRRGLGTAMMTMLAAAREPSATTQALVATDAGRALYQSIGWTVHAPYTTAFIP